MKNVTLQQAAHALCEMRNAALTGFANRMLDDGLSVHDTAFADAMLEYAHELEDWRHDVYVELVQMLVEAEASEPRTVH
jgi:hypothetical protein